MSKALFRVIRTAPLTQLQDAGRFGHLHLGFSHSGPMDESAFAINQQLFGDDGSSAQLEFAPGGLMLEVLADVTIAISGAYMQPLLNGKPLVNFCAHQLKQGDRLDFGFAKRGIYAYLAVKGGFAGRVRSVHACAAGLGGGRSGAHHGPGGPLAGARCCAAGGRLGLCMQCRHTAQRQRGKQQYAACVERGKAGEASA